MKVGEGIAVGVEACTEAALLTGRSVGGTSLGVKVAVGGKGVRVGGMGVAVAVAAITFSSS